MNIVLYINGNTIKLTRGDTAYLQIPLATTDGMYQMDLTDTLTFSVKKKTSDTDYIFQKVVNGEDTIHIEPTDTASLTFGKYVYDIQLTTNNGDVFTVVPPSTFEVLTEVTC
jgi:hypothetical protein